jgi:uncharacterized protein YndB with AHSA1/START domain
MSNEVTVHMNASPEAVYDLVTDVTRMGEWSPECVRCEWQDGARSAAPGARFKGWNKRGIYKWSAVVEVRTADRPDVFAFVTKIKERDGTIWTYRFAPHDGGTDVTESFETVFEPKLIGLVEKVFIRNRHGEMIEGMRTTLERIRAVVERANAPG